MPIAAISTRFPLALALALALAAGCGSKESKPRDGTSSSSDPFDWPAAKGAGAVTVTADSSGRISGKVSYSGTPEIEKLSVPTDRASCGTSMPDPTLTVKEGALLDAVIWLEGAAGAVQPGEIRLTQARCRYEPHVSVGIAGSKVIVGNEDPILHNVHGHVSGDEWFNRATQGAGSSTTQTLEAPGIRTLTCDVHPFMKGFVLGFDHPYFAKVDDAGSFSFAAPAPGKYTLVVWHGKLGVKKQVVEIAAGGGLQVSAVYP